MDPIVHAEYGRMYKSVYVTITHKLLTLIFALGALRERNAQGQSLCNLAYAYSQLKNYGMAEYYYQEALNAFVDVGKRAASSHYNFRFVINPHFLLLINQ